jgi:hypothetical protein
MADYRTVKVDLRVPEFLIRDVAFRFRVKPLATEFLFPDGSIHVFPNWDIKGFRERFYMEEYVNVPSEEYLRLAAESGEMLEHGILTSDIKRFVEKNAEFFEDLTIKAANGLHLDGSPLGTDEF